MGQDRPQICARPEDMERRVRRNQRSALLGRHFLLEVEQRADAGEVERAPPELVAELARKHGVEMQIYYTSRNFELMARWQKVVPGGLGMVWLGT